LAADAERILPGGLENPRSVFIAGKHLSGTHLAMASYRMQPLLAQLGQAADVAAAFCARNQVTPRRLSFAELLDTAVASA